MKRLSTLICLLFLLCYNPIYLIGQDGCVGSDKNYFLNGNNIRAAFSPRGNKFFSSHGGFQVPFPADQQLSTIFASSPWIGAFDDAENLKLAAETYSNPSTPDYRVGPLSNIGLPLDTLCNFDRVWNIYYEDIISHQNDFEADGVIDDTISSVFGWPASGNAFFSTFNGFELPSDYVQGWADFYDKNGNGRYEPDEGDYPAVNFKNKKYVPDQILWMVFNDSGEHEESGGSPLRVEIQLTAFAFHCQDNDLLNNTIFNNYKIINRAVTSLDSIFFGIWTDYDLGCAGDDFTGSDSIRSTEFVYNADALDGDSGIDCSTGSGTYASHPPAQSMTYLSHPMNSFISIPYSSSTTPESFYNQLNGLWADGTPITPEGDGYDPGSSVGPTKFLYSGDPRDTASWAAINVIEEGYDTRTLSSVRLDRLDPGEIEIVETAYMFHQDSTGDHLDQITEMYENVDSLILSLDDLIGTCAVFPICEKEDCVWPGDFNHDGIADHFDLLHWGVMYEGEGPSRTPQVNWRGYLSNDWEDTTADDVNYKHGDASGNGVVNLFDLDINVLNYLDTIPSYLRINTYPLGPELLVSATAMTPDGKIPSVQISTATEINNVLGIAYEVEFDTTIFELNTRFITRWPSASNWIGYYDGFYDDGGAVFTYSHQYGFVQADHQPLNIDAGSELQRTFSRGLTLKEGLTIEDVPDSTVIRLRNLTAIDAEGNNLNIGANELVVYKYGLTSLKDPVVPETNIYPNPAHDHIYLDVPDQTRVEICNPQAQIIEVRYVNDQSLDLSDYVPGLYYLRFPTMGRVCKLVIH